jgi:hypothetical protein
MANLDFCKICGCSISGEVCPYCKAEQKETLCCEREGCNGTPSRGETICNDCWESYYSRDIPGFPDDPSSEEDQDIYDLVFGPRYELGTGNEQMLESFDGPVVKSERRCACCDAEGHCGCELPEPYYDEDIEDEDIED